MKSTEATDRPLTRRGAVRMAGLAALAGSLGLAASAASAQTGLPADGWPIGVWRTRAASRPTLNRQDVQSLDVFLHGGIYLRFDSPVERTASLTDIPDAIEYTGPFAGQWTQLPSGDVRVTAVQLNYDRTATLWSEERLALNLRHDAATDTMSGTYDWRETALDGTLILEAVGLAYQGERITVPV
jgi:hypothetical protein